MAKLQITVDDGPEPVASALDAILAELKTRGIVGAFFNLGQEVQNSPAATKKILEQGHALGNHSWDHLEPATANYTDAQILKQFRDTHDAVLSATRHAMKFWRAPRLQQISRLQGLLTGGENPLYQLSHCDIHADSKDSKGANDAASMLAAIRSDIASNPSRTTFRLLFHVKPTTASALKQVLDGLVSDGHVLVNFMQTT